MREETDKQCLGGKLVTFIISHSSEITISVNSAWGMGDKHFSLIKLYKRVKITEIALPITD